MGVINISSVTTAICLLLLCIDSVPVSADDYVEKEIGNERVSFVRSAVESVPEKDEFRLAAEELGRFSMKPSFGDTFLPLRSAVENVPSIGLRSALEAASSLTAGLRSFVRDSVEASPSEDEDDLRFYDDDDAFSEIIAEKLEMLPESGDVGDLDSKVEIFDDADTWTNTDTYGAFVVPNKYDDEFPQPFRSGSPYQQLVKSADVEDVYIDDDVDVFQDNFGYGTLAQIKAINRKSSQSPKVLCYFTNWAYHRQADGKFAPENLDPELCTALIYSFASLDADHLTVREFDPWVDIENGYYKRAIATGIPVLIALGGWTDSTGDKYSRLAADDIKRKVFASSLVGFIQRHGFSGVHLDWTYPKCWQSDCSKGPASDKPNFTKLVNEIRSEFDRVDRKLQLGVAISGYKEIITEAYQLSELSKLADFLTVMAYDYHGAWERQTGHVSPLYGRNGDRYPHYTTDFTMQLLLKNGALKEKLIMGIPFYGQTFTLAEESNIIVGEGVSAVGPGEPGEFTKQPGMMAYYEICSRIRKNKWLVGRDAELRSGPYAMLRNQWVGYEDAASVEVKARYAMNNGFGGVAAWTVDLDDFQNRCCSEAFPLLKSINRVLGRVSSPPPTRNNCNRPPQPVTPVAPVMTTISSDGSPGTVSTPVHEHTTWPNWQQSTVAAAPATTATTTTTTTTTTRKPTSTVWWVQPQSTSSTTAQPAWTPSSTTTQTTRRPTTTHRPLTTASSPIYNPLHTTIPSPAVVRPEVQKTKCKLGEYLPDRSNCNAYYRCISEDELRQQFCPGGLNWNENYKLCDWPASAQCTVQKKKKPLTLPTKQPSYQQQPSKFTTTRSPKPVSTSFVTRRTTPTAPPTRAPPKKRTTTKRPTNNRHTPKPLTTTRPTAPAVRPTKCSNGEYMAHRDCGQYYVCVNEVLVPNSCGSNLQWDARKKYCDWPHNVKCVTAKQYLRIVKSKATVNDPCGGKSMVGDPTNCNRFLYCQWDRLQVGECAPGLHWNAVNSNCDWPINANCKEAISVDELLPPGNEIQPGGRPVQAKPATTITTKRPTTARPTYPTDKPDLEPLNGYYKVVCYFTNWAWYRKGAGRYTPDDINTDLCTHIVYGFAVLDYSELIMRTHDSWADIDNNFYTRVSGLRDKGVKVSLALGGWNDSQGDKYSRLVRSPSSRSRFVRHAIEFIEKYGFEGLDLDWEYPVCWQTECNKGKPDEKEGFTALVRELSEAFKPRGLLLSTAVSPSKKIIDAGYDVPKLARYFDWIAVMTYDFHGQWDKKTGHVAPLYYHPDDDFDYFNANYSLNYWIERGAPSRKIVMGMPLYGQSFTLASTKENGLNSKAPGPGQAGEFTRAAGFLAYYEICDRIKTQGWEVIQDERGRMGPFARKGSQWVSFDDPAIIRKKSQLIRALDLGGGMVWALDLDDFKNRCGEGIHPLLTQIHEVLKSPPSDYEPMPGLIPIEPESIEDSQPDEDQLIPSDIETVVDENDLLTDPNKDIEEGSFELVKPSTETTTDDFKVVCYFTNWAWYRQGGGKFLPEDIDPELCTHIVYGFAVLDRDRLTIKPHDSWADLDNKFYERVAAFRSKKIKVTVAIGGWNDSAGDKYARLVRNAASRARFIRQVTEFIETYGFDGLDLDWEYPVCWQVDCKKGAAEEKEGFAALVREISEVFKPKRLLLSSAVSPNKKVIDAGYDVPTLTRYFDWIAVMTYDFHGQWDKKTGHVAPMYAHPDFDQTFNANFSINYWLEKGADRKKIIMGMPMYGQSFSLAQASEHDLNAPTYGGGEAGEATRARGFLAYYEICSYIQKRSWTVVRDPRGRMGPYAYSRDQWVSFDDAPMIRHKSEYVKAMGLGGAMIWALDLDDFKNDCGCESYPLLKTINRVLRNYRGTHPKCKLEPNSKTMLAKEMGSSTPMATAAIVGTSQNLQSVGNIPDVVDLNCYGRAFTSHQRDCNKYYMCQYGGLIEQRCPDGLHWNENHCDWPQNSRCRLTNDLTTKRPIIHRPKPTRGVPSKPSKKPAQPNQKKPAQKPFQKPILKPKPTSDIPQPGGNNNSEYKVVCYFTNWAWYRPGQGKYVPEDIDENLCTHIVYGFAVLNGQTLTIRTHDSWADIDNKFYERVVAYKKKGIRVTLAIGGWNDSLGNKYSRLVLDPQARAKFIRNVIEFIEKYGFEGLDLDWEYPVCWQVDCKKGSPEEKQGFAALVRELSEAFKPIGLLLSSAVSPSKTVIDAGYDVPTLAKYFDWIAVMTYDFHGNWDKQTGHVAPLYYVDGDSNEYFNGNFSINYWIEKGTPPKKLVMGMPLYGQSFALADSKNRGLNQKTVGPGQAGTYTRAGGFLAYYEICGKVSDGGWTVIRDPQGRIGPYAYNGNQWVSYDDVSDIRRKSKFIKSLNLGGGMVWALDLDDFRGRCGCGKHPLLRTMNQELRGIPGQRASDCT